MRAKQFTVVGSAGGPAYSPVYPIDTYGNPTCIGIGVVVSGPLTVADVQYSFSNPWEINLNTASAGVWSPDATLVSATQANSTNWVSTNYAFPPRALRLRVRALASASVGEQATIVIQQAGPEGAP